MPASREAEGHGPGCRPQIGRDPSWAGGSEAQNRFCSLPASRLFAQSDRLEGSKEPAGGGRGGREAHPPLPGRSDHTGAQAKGRGEPGRQEARKCFPAVAQRRPAVGGPLLKAGAP